MMSTYISSFIPIQKDSTVLVIDQTRSFLLKQEIFQHGFHVLLKLWYLNTVFHLVDLQLIFLSNGPDMRLHQCISKRLNWWHNVGLWFCILLHFSSTFFSFILISWVTNYMYLHLLFRKKKGFRKKNKMFKYTHWDFFVKVNPRKVSWSTCLNDIFF